VRLFRRREAEQSAMLSLAMGAVIGPSLSLVTQPPSPIPAAVGFGLLGAAASFALTARRWIRRWHRYEGATLTLRDVWIEARLAEDRSILVHKSNPAPLGALQARSRASWLIDARRDDPSVE
jgi:hypothetical protein